VHVSDCLFCMCVCLSVCVRMCVSVWVCVCMFLTVYFVYCAEFSQSSNCCCSLLPTLRRLCLVSSYSANFTLLPTLHRLCLVSSYPATFTLLPILRHLLSCFILFCHFHLLCVRSWTGLWLTGVKTHTHTHTHTHT
jgi:hypothetical protein